MVFTSIVLTLLAFGFLAVNDPLIKKLGVLLLTGIVIFWLLNNGIALLFGGIVWVATWAFKIVALTFLMTLWLVFSGPFIMVFGKK